MQIIDHRSSSNSKPENGAPGPLTDSERQLLERIFEERFDKVVDEFWVAYKVPFDWFWTAMSLQNKGILNISFTEHTKPKIGSIRSFCYASIQEPLPEDIKQLQVLCILRK